MSVALNDTLIWRDMLREVPDLNDYRKMLQCLSSFQRQRRTSHSFVVNVLAQALYALFSASDGKICSYVTDGTHLVALFPGLCLFFGSCN